MAVDQFRGRSAPNPIGSAFQGLGQNIADNLTKQREAEELELLIESAQSGDPLALARLAQSSPQAANVVIGLNKQRAEQQQLAEQQDVERVANIARTALSFGDPKKARNYLIQVANQEKDPEVKQDIIEGLNLDDDALIFNLRDDISRIDQKPFEQAKGKDLQGHVFNPNTGEFSVNTQLQAEIDATQAAIEAKGNKFDNKDIISINDKVGKLTDDARDIRASATALGKLKENSSAASKLAAIFKFMKALDPTSVVRETEQGQVYAAQGAASQLAGMLNGIVGKGKLTDEGFKDVVSTSKVLANAAISSSKRAVDSFLNVFDQIPESTDKKLRKRVPELFEIKQEQQQRTLTLKQKFDQLPETEKQKVMSQATPEELKKLGISKPTNRSRRGITR